MSIIFSLLSIRIVYPRLTANVGVEFLILYVNVVLNVLYTVGIHSFRIYKIHAFSGKFLLSDVHRRQYVQLCCSDTHRNSLPKNKSRILKIGWLTKKNNILKSSRDTPTANGIPKKTSSPEIRR